MIQHKTKWTTSSAEKILATSCTRIPTVARYCLDVLTGNIATGRMVFLAVERFLRDLEEGHKRGLRFDEDAASRPIKFFRDCAPFRLIPFQQFAVANLYGWKSADGFRRFRTAYMEIGKGNGKSPLVGGLGLFALLLDREPNAEVYFAATMKEQAKISFRDATIIRDGNAALRKRIAKHRDNLSVASTNSFCRPISSEHRGLDGKRPHFTGIDEVHEHPTAMVVDKMRAGTKGRRQALVFLITNSGHDRETVCYHWHDYSRKIVEGVLENDAHFAYVCHLDPCEQCREKGHEQPNADCASCDSWLDEDTWIKANPGLGVIIQKKYLQEQITEAVAMPSKENIVRRLSFCMWTQAETRAISTQAWKACAGHGTEDPVEWRQRKLEQLKGKRCFGGMDLASTTDMVATGYIFPPQDGVEKAVFLPFFFIPKEAAQQRVMRDRVSIDVWVRWGLVTETDGAVTDYDVVRRHVAEMHRDYQVEEMGFDPWNAQQLVTQLETDGCKMVKISQTISELTGPTKHFLKMIAGQEFEHGNNPALNWQADNLVTRSDPSGNIRPVKPENPNSPKKIDGIVAGIMAIDRMTATPADDGGSVTAIARCHCGELCIGKRTTKGDIVYDCGKHGQKP